MRDRAVAVVALSVAVGGSTTAGAAAGAPAVYAAAGGRSAASSLQADRLYSMRAIYLDRNRFRSVADCLTAAYAQRLPLELCR
jgi:hypothetical protein